MRTRLLALVALVALCLGTALVAVPSQAAAPLPWTLCSGNQTSCILSAQADTGSGFADTPPGPNGSARDFPWVQPVDSNLIDFGVSHDIGSGSTNNALDHPDAAYRMVVRTGSFIPREMHAVARGGSYSISHDPVLGWTFTVEFKPTSVHHTNSPCSVDAGCGDATTKASPDMDLPGFATGDVQTLAGSGLSLREIAQRTGMYTFTNAQDSYIFYNIDLGVLEVRLANPHLQADGTTPVTDGSYDAFIPNAFLTGTVGVPNPAALPGFVVTKTIGGTTIPASATMTHTATGIVFHISGISFSRPTYRLKPRATPPGRPRSVSAKKIAPRRARVSFTRPLLNGGRPIGYYQARCQRVGNPWHYAVGSGSPIVVGGLPLRRVWCEVRAHNARGYGLWSALVRSS